MRIAFDWHETADGTTLHVAHGGAPQGRLVLCLHGFPEHWVAWRAVMAELAADHRLVAPDLRGYNLSSRPAGLEAYRMAALVGDVAALVDRLSPEAPVVLAGHDWGAALAYAYAFAHPGRVSHLVVANGVHPVPFQRAILADPEQRRASQYIARLRAADAEALLAEDDFRRLLRMIEGFSRADWMDEGRRAAYRAAWRRPGALTGMLNWYRASPLVVPGVDEALADAPLLSVPPDQMAVPMPHLVVWGEDDEALRPSCLEGLEAFAPRLAVQRIAGAGHWVLHEKPAAVAAAIRAFLG
ncbi:alpha/beta fold hydrolase [Aquibium sp. A9E412]|uniref:alpha/beta fold hydrolase n=1 Tax=Aquibium sp. A9E412 TaxID=2976767 RepID=UPI0025B274FF|nr:alpha/beta fold hydrolase [Aquibium sp. A9E412]MDN2568453.1 alpha/beta fold hydrolase [Aquibium sp. A9E412]